MALGDAITGDITLDDRLAARLEKSQFARRRGEPAGAAARGEMKSVIAAAGNATNCPEVDTVTLGVADIRDELVSHANYRLAEGLENEQVGANPTGQHIAPPAPGEPVIATATAERISAGATGNDIIATEPEQAKTVVSPLTRTCV